MLPVSHSGMLPAYGGTGVTLPAAQTGAGPLGSPAPPSYTSALVRGLLQVVHQLVGDARVLARGEGKEACLGVRG